MRELINTRKKSMVNFKNFAKIITVSLVTIATTIIMSSSALAAGTLTVSVEPASGSFQTGSSNALTIYGTTSGANTGGFSFTVTLVNMTIVSFDPSGNPFSLDSVSSGGTPGSTSVTITTGYSSLAGGSGKQLVGKLNTLASSSAGTATARVTGIDAYDANLAPMTGVASNASYTITAPAAPATPPANTTTTPPANTTNKATIPTSAAKPTSTAQSTAVAQPAVGETTPETVPQSTIDEILETQSPDAQSPDTLLDQESEPQTSSSSSKYIFIAIPVIAILVVAGILLYKNRRMLMKSPQSQMSGAAGSTTATPTQTPANTPNPEIDNYLKPEPPAAETVIHPTNKE